MRFSQTASFTKIHSCFITERYITMFHDGRYSMLWFHNSYWEVRGSNSLLVFTLQLENLGNTLELQEELECWCTWELYAELTQFTEDAEDGTSERYWSLNWVNWYNPSLPKWICNRTSRFACEFHIAIGWNSKQSYA